jgi:hypothetical protein
LALCESGFGPRDSAPRLIVPPVEKEHAGPEVDSALIETSLERQLAVSE